MSEVTQIETVIEKSLRQLKDLIDVNTVIGTPFTSTDGTVIVPVSKVTMGFAVGGGEYNGYNKENYPMTAGSGGYVQLSPLGFLVGTGKEMRAVGITAPTNSLNKLLDTALDFINKQMNKDEVEPK